MARYHLIRVCAVLRLFHCMGGQYLVTYVPDVTGPLSLHAMTEDNKSIKDMPRNLNVMVIFAQTRSFCACAAGLLTDADNRADTGGDCCAQQTAGGHFEGAPTASRWHSGRHR